MYWFYRYRKVLHEKLPPLAPTSVFQNMKTLASHDFESVYFVHRLSKSIKEQKPLDKSEYNGNTFRISMPQLQPFLFTTDYKLSKLLLSGSQEAEKSDFMTYFNVLNRNVSSILTHRTNNEDRAKARKAIAPAFSSSNLQTTWKELRHILSAQLDYLCQLSSTDTTFDLKTLSLKLFLSSIATSGLGVKISFDGQDDENTIDGLKYMEESDIAIQEKSNEIVLPFRRWHFWDPSVARGKQACLRMKKEMEKVAALHRRRKEGSIEATAPPRSIIDHLMGHNYPSEEALLSDLWIVIFAGHETSAATLCFALMELAKNPSVKNKLRSELAAFMPDQPSLIDLSQQESSNLLSTIANSPYLNNCIKESMRLWPAAGGSLRALDEDFHYDGMVIPAGSIVNIHLFAMFRSDWIANAETYDPDRWLDSNSQLPQLKEMFFPFSAGKRTCIGQNMAMLQLRVITAFFYPLL